MLWDILIAASLVIGAVFALVGSYGLIKLDNPMSRLHAPTKSSTLGVGAMLIASMLWHWGHGEWALRELLITLFLFVTAPISANLMAQAALHLRLPSRAEPPDDLDRS